MIWSLIPLGVMIGIYAYIVRIAIHRRPALHIHAKYSFRYWWLRVAHMTK